MVSVSLCDVVTIVVFITKVSVDVLRSLVRHSRAKFMLYYVCTKRVNVKIQISNHDIIVLYNF